MVLILGRYRYSKDEYGKTFIEKDGELYERGSKSLRYLLEYIELLEDGKSYDDIQELKYYVTQVEYKNRTIGELLKQKSQ